MFFLTVVQDKISFIEINGDLKTDISALIKNISQANIQHKWLIYFIKVEQAAKSHLEQWQS